MCIRRARLPHNAHTIPTLSAQQIKRQLGNRFSALAQLLDESSSVGRGPHQVDDDTLDGGNGHRHPQVAVVLGSPFGQQLRNLRTRGEGEFPVRIRQALIVAKGGPGRRRYEPRAPPANPQ